ncbi:hypothetical protein ACFQ67_00285 [Streptomyces sp. NPDC056488]|uniref:hypothetical protein n=1 Tax=Streptomyces sp. NPDC056488 TaxID=3345836 RepID=UPI0036B7F6A5
MTAARRLHTTRALLDQPPTPAVPGQLHLDEAVPDGTFGGRHTTTPTPRPPLRPWTPQEQYQHRQDLLDALDGWDWHDDYQEARRTRERNRRARA